MYNNNYSGAVWLQREGAAAVCGGSLNEIKFSNFNMADRRDLTV